MSEPTPREPNVELFARRGDVDVNGSLNLTDGIVILNYLFFGGSLDCPLAADANSDMSTDLVDAIFLFNHLFLGGPAPLAEEVPCN